MRIDPAGWPFVIVSLGLAVTTGWAAGWRWAAPAVGLAGACLFFFRDPERTVPADPDLVVAPADGRILAAGPASAAEAPPGVWQQITIFLSPLDVHVNRTPVGGRVTRIVRRPGRFLPAYRPESGAANERTEIWIECDGTPIVCRQVVGVLARRIVCRLREGDLVARGQRFGVMKFGSRMDVFVPASARLLVAAGDRVVGGETPVAQLDRAA